MRALITGAGNMGRAIRAALEDRGDDVAAMVGRSTAPAPAAAGLGRIDVAFEFSHPSALTANVRYAIDAGARNLVIGTTGWADQVDVQDRLNRLANESGLRVVVGPTFSVGVVVFTEVAEEAARRFGQFAEYDPYLLEWHRRAKADRHFLDDRLAVQGVRLFAPHLETQLLRRRRQVAIHVMLEELLELRRPLAGPLLLAGHALAVEHHQRVGGLRPSGELIDRGKVPALRGRGGAQRNARGEQAADS